MFEFKFRFVTFDTHFKLILSWAGKWSAVFI